MELRGFKSKAISNPRAAAAVLRMEAPRAELSSPALKLRDWSCELSNLQIRSCEALASPPQELLLGSFASELRWHAPSPSQLRWLAPSVQSLSSDGLPPVFSLSAPMACLQCSVSQLRWLASSVQSLSSKFQSFKIAATPKSEASNRR